MSLHQDDAEIPCPHLHLYSEGYADKRAFPVPLDRFANISDRWALLADFMSYINITVPPDIRRGLFT